jgi:hypothetical protein
MKKNCYWMVFVFLALIFGCAKAIIRTDVPKTFPNVEILMAKLDRTEALAILKRHLLCRESKNYPCEVQDDGFYYTNLRSRQDRENFIDHSYTIPRQATRITTTSWKEPGVLYFNEIQRLEVKEESSDLYNIRLYAPRTGRLFNCKYGKDEVIAALLTLCPNIK